MKHTTSRQRSTIPYWVAIGALHLAGLALLFPAVGQYPVLIGMAFLAYSFGLRHALDFDHITAIDNAVRKMSQDKADTTGVGFWFSLGHSSVVLVLSVLLAVASGWVASHLGVWGEWGSVWGPAISGAFLLLIGLLNLGLWWGSLQQFLQVRAGTFDPAAQPVAEGLLVRLFRPLFKRLSKAWHLYPLGFLFGLGFDTASEVALLALSSQAGAQSLPWTGFLALPLLFAAGMSLLDFLDGFMMTRAWNWSQARPVKRIWYNLTITGLSVVTAVFIGGLELLQVAGPALGLANTPLAFLLQLDVADFGWTLVAASAVLWLVSWLWWKRSEAQLVNQSQGE